MSTFIKCPWVLLLTFLHVRTSYFVCICEKVALGRNVPCYNEHDSRTRPTTRQYELCAGDDIKEWQVVGGCMKGQLQGTETKSQTRLQGDGRVPCQATHHWRWGSGRLTPYKSRGHCLGQ